MKRIMLLVVSMIIVSCAMAQSKIIGVSNYFPRDDSITVSIAELNYLISHSHIVCSKIDTLEDGSMIKTVEIETNDSGFRLIGAYVESEAFFPKDCVHTVENCQWILKCEYALVDDGELYESYMLDSIGRKYFQKLLNMTPLVCIDMQKGHDGLRPVSWSVFFLRGGKYLPIENKQCFNIQGKTFYS